jgi:ribosomal protein uS17
MSDIENEQNNTGEPAETEAPAAEAETVEEGTPAEPEAAVEPEAAADPEPEPEATAEPKPETPAEEPEPAAEEPDAEAPAAAEVPAAEAPAPAPPAQQSARTRLRKHVPRSARRTRTKPQRERPKTRKPIIRLDKPEHERGRRQERRGVVVSDAMDKTIVVKVESVRAHQRYKKVIRRSTKFHAHDEQNQAHVGDLVRIVETKPLSKTKRWRLAEVLEQAK